MIDSESSAGNTINNVNAKLVFQQIDPETIRMQNETDYMAEVIQDRTK